MFNTFLRENKIAAGILTVLRLYLGYSWFTAGLGKITGGFDASGFLKNAVANPVKGPDGSVVYGWYVDFLQGFALPNVELFNFLIPWGETLVGLGLLLGCLTTAAMFFGLVMNFSFFLAGTVSHNPTDIFLGFIILAAGYNAGRYGLDRWVVPFIRKTTWKTDYRVKQNA
ncbi:DoxX family membrane protein [Neobacillus thermocopriae]|uniref:DoxX family membrane protein n=1 Tax=Neobacillus thermocopriae TaxID=1215031 RepID=A0A6B3TPF6_9BACI|nr:DoxX family membrane protein [Neobacillus thermocopriae]MED3624725.1 DoxX family membrane protein [Neobacillus thermocopriae]MED3713125.1 DoxX family membrane protein [Neobacillus thermocopriae]NEX78498.1 DoxX family membrane protein [Neobacillus thermocopriae]